MASPITAQLLLADAPQVDPTSGKVHLLGAGWSVTGTPTAPQAVVAFIGVPWDRTNQQLPLRLQLLDEDGEQVRLAGPLEEQVVSAETTLEVGRPAGLAAGTTISAPFSLSLPSMPLAPGRYEWRLEVAAEPFSVFFLVQAG